MMLSAGESDHSDNSETDEPDERIEDGEEKQSILLFVCYLKSHQDSFFAVVL